MSWEVRSMKSKTSLFSPGLSRNILSRFWPLWLLYLGALLVQLPVTVSGYLAQGISVRYTMDRILQLSVDVAGYAMIASVLSVMAAFSYLYSKRSCSLINSLPLRRETAFVTDNTTVPLSAFCIIPVTISPFLSLYSSKIMFLSASLTF